MILNPLIEQMSLVLVIKMRKWQTFAGSGFSNVKFNIIAINIFLGFEHLDNIYKLCNDYLKH